LRPIDGTARQEHCALHPGCFRRPEKGNGSEMVAVAKAFRISALPATVSAWHMIEGGVDKKIDA
jgi:hypothetical protein